MRNYTATYKLLRLFKEAFKLPKSSVTGKLPIRLTILIGAVKERNR